MLSEEDATVFVGADAELQSGLRRRTRDWNMEANGSDDQWIHLVKTSRASSSSSQVSMTCRYCCSCSSCLMLFREEKSGFEGVMNFCSFCALKKDMFLTYLQRVSRGLCSEGFMWRSIIIVVLSSSQSSTHSTLQASFSFSHTYSHTYSYCTWSCALKLVIAHPVWAPGSWNSCPAQEEGEGGRRVIHVKDNGRLAALSAHRAFDELQTADLWPFLSD